MIKRIVEIVDLCIDIGGLCTIDDFTGGKDTRSKQLPCPLHFRSDKNLARPAGRVVDRSCAKREVLDQRPALLRHQFIRALRTMSMAIAIAATNGLAGQATSS